MPNAYFKIQQPKNEPVKGYLPGSKERESLKKELKRQSEQVVDIPIIIGGQSCHTENKGTCVMPHNHSHQLATYSIAGEKELKAAIEAALEAKENWETMPWEHRASIFLKAADLIAGPYRDLINASTMLGQSKTVVQAEIDAACELADFLRFNVYFAQQLYEDQPNSVDGTWNRMEYRALDGFVAAISPFNFTSIGGNLPTAPAIMGNTVLWKPSSTAVLSNYYVLQVLIEAGLPAGVINFVPCRGAQMSEFVLKDSRLAGFHFTGSTEVFSGVWQLIGENIKNYATYPRLVGETGGKDFIFAHKSAHIQSLATAIIRGAFEFQGQKCSAASRAYIPQSLWGALKEILLAETAQLKVGDIQDFTNFMGAVIDKKAYDSITSYIEYAKNSPDAEVLCTNYSCEKGYFIEPTIILAKTPDFKTMKEEIFGPVITIYVYEDDALEETLALCDTVSPYALTGAIFGQDRAALIAMEKALSHSAGNFYINDKPTGAVIGQQPFGGARASGTNDKAGSMLNLIRWANPRTIKENFVPITEIKYPFMDGE